jgi:hypothetical protein
MSSPDRAYATGAAVGADGHIYVVGSFSGATMTIDSTTVNFLPGGGSNSYANFLAKFDSAGAVVYVKVRTRDKRTGVSGWLEVRC